MAVYPTIGNEVSVLVGEHLVFRERILREFELYLVWFQATFPKVEADNSKVDEEPLFLVCGIVYRGSFAAMMVCLVCNEVCIRLRPEVMVLKAVWKGDGLGEKLSVWMEYGKVSEREMSEVDSFGGWGRMIDLIVG